MLELNDTGMPLNECHTPGSTLANVIAGLCAASAQSSDAMRPRPPKVSPEASASTSTSEE